MNNRTPIVLFATLCTTLFACQQDPTKSEIYQQLLQDKEQTARRADEKDATIDLLLGSFNRISDNLQAIKTKQGLLSEGATQVENSGDMEQKIMDDLAGIDELLSENKELVANLKKDLKGNDKEIKGLAKTIAGLEAMIIEKDGEISVLKEELSSTNSSLATLIEMYKEQSQLNESQQEELNTAYYAFGTRKELLENGVLTKEGGIVGLGATKKLNTADLNLSYFKRVDVTKTDRIPIVSRKAKLITSHPQGSYQFNGEVDEIQIIDAEAFWSISNYLVIEVE